jgi:hypothetical protein
VTKDEQVEKEFELHRLHEGDNPFESEEELSDRIAELEADLAGLVPICSERPLVSPETESAIQKEKG